jgi:hypothetical protein
MEDDDAHESLRAGGKQPRRVHRSQHRPSWSALRLCEPVRLSARLTDPLSRRLRAAFLLASSLFVAAQG